MDAIVVDQNRSFFGQLRPPILWQAALLLSALFLALPRAQAASFDCAKARTAVEKAICTSPDLSKLDDTLLVAYKTALGGLTRKAAAELKSSQRHWLDFVQRACTKDASVAKSAYDDIGRDCLATVYRDRIAVLESSRMLGGYRFYPVGIYDVRPEAEGGANAVAVTNSVNVAEIDGTSALARAFNAEMAKQLTAVRGRTAPTGQAEVDNVDSSVIIRPESVSASLITMEVYSQSYIHGAAHGLYGISYLNFRIDEKRPLAAEDIFSGKGWQRALAALGYAKLKEYLANRLTLDGPKDIVSSVSDPGNWLLQNEGLRLQFQPYEVAPYSERAPAVTVPWRALKPYLAPRAKVIIEEY